MLQILLHEGAVIHFTNNFATELGAGLYVETTSSDFILSVLNTGCFIRYNSSLVDVPPSKWVRRVMGTGLKIWNAKIVDQASLLTMDTSLLSTRYPMPLFHLPCFLSECYHHISQQPSGDGRSCYLR